MKSKERNFSFDIARAIAMIWIVGFWHATDYSPQYAFFLKKQNFSFISSQLTATMLGTFMFISAYLLASKNTFASRFDITNYFKKRVVRIIPLLALSMLCLPNSTFQYWDFLTKFLNLIGIAGYTSFKLIPTLWFVSILISFYIILPFIVSQKKLSRKILISIILEIIFYIGYEFNFVENRIPLYFPAFALGIILSDTHIKIIEKRKVFFKTSVFFSITYILLMFIPFLQKTNYVGAFIGFFPLIAISMYLEPFFKSTFCIKTIMFFSYTSLVSYMFHRQIYMAFWHLGYPKDGIHRIVLIYLVVLPLLFFFSYLVQSSYDKFITYLNNKNNKHIMS